MRSLFITLFFFLIFCIAKLPISSTNSVDNDWHFDVTANANLRELAINGQFSPVGSLEMSVNTGAEPYVRDVEIDFGEGWRVVPKRDDSWFLPQVCRTRHFNIRYRFMLADASRSLNNIELAKLHGSDTFLSPPSAWLMRPMSGGDNRLVYFHVNTPPGNSFITGIFPVENGAKDTYVAPASEIPDMAYSAFGVFRRRTVKFVGGVVEIAIAKGEINLGDEAIFKWVSTSAKALSSYYGKLPIKRILVLVRPAAYGGDVGYGTTLGNGGAAVSIVVGKNTRQSTLDEDWIMTHELVHCAFPSVARSRHAWAEEGLATYVEPWARVRVGTITPEDAWNDVLRDMPQGIQSYGDRGLDNSRSWESIYWSGALFYLMADVEIRERTNNRKGLEDALRGIAAAGGTVDVTWALNQAFREGDRSVGVTVLEELYKRNMDTPLKYDLNNLWQKLGVERRGGSIYFNDRAPLASVRKAITFGKRNS